MKYDRPLYKTLYIPMLLTAFICISAGSSHAQISWFKKSDNTQKSGAFLKQTTQNPSSNSFEISDEELEKRKQENAALSQKLGISIPEYFDQKQLSASGAQPESSDDLKTRQKIKRQNQFNSLNLKKAKSKSVYKQQLQKKITQTKAYNKTQSSRSINQSGSNKKIYQGTNSSGVKVYKFKH